MLARGHDGALRVLHVRTQGLSTDQAVGRVEAAVGSLDGVIGVTAAKWLALTSVLYDAGRLHPTDIVHAIRAEGFDAQPIARVEHRTTA